MSSICLTLLVTAPCRLKHYSFFDIGESASYEDDVLTFELLERAATKRILPANDILRKRLKDYGGDFRVAIALSGKALDLYERIKPEVLDSFKSLAETGFVEFISAPHHNSLASLFSPQEFQEQAIMHRDRIHALFGITPTAFRNTGLIYSQAQAAAVEQLDFQVIFAGASDKLLGRRSPNAVYRPATCSSLKLLVDDAALSKKVSERLINSDRPDPTPAALSFTRPLPPIRGAVTTLTIDLNGFTTDRQDAAGLFEFIDHLPEAVLTASGHHFETPTRAALAHKPTVSISTPDPVSGIPAGHDLSPWLGNEMQKDALNALYLLEPRVKGRQDPVLLGTWRMLQSADHFLKMSTHNGTPEISPYDAYINFMNILTDFSERIGN